MFRVVTTVEPNNLFMLCDNRRCSYMSVQAIDPGLDIVGRNRTAQEFIEGRKLEGWAVGLDGIFCPDCVKREQELAEKAKAEANRVLLATPVDQKMAERAVGKLGIG